VQNFTEIGKSAAQLWQKKTIFSMATIYHLVFKRFSRWQFSAIFNFSGPRMGYLKAHVGLPTGGQYRP